MEKVILDVFYIWAEFNKNVKDIKVIVTKRLMVRLGNIVLLYFAPRLIRGCVYSFLWVRMRLTKNDCTP